MQTRLPGIVLDEQIAAFTGLEKAQVECQLGAGTGGFELVEQLLVIDRLRSLRKRTFLIYVFDAAQQTISRHLTLVEPAQWLDLARQSIRSGQHGSLPQEVFARPGER